jgi:deoxyribose-phosphate aldolase
MGPDPTPAVPSTDRAPLLAYADLASLMDHSLLRPELSDDDVAAGCRMALQYGVCSVSVRPSDLETAFRMLEGASVVLGSTVGFPHGASTTAVKIYETRDLIRRGARQIELVANTGKLISRQFQYVESEVLQIAKACHESGAVLKVTLESEFLAGDLKVIALKICKRCEADFVKTSTGLSPTPGLAEDLALMKRVLKDLCRIEAAGVGGLDEALSAYEMGADRIGSAETQAVLDSWKRRLASQNPAAT